ncbi:hypothetical protein P167DRAFT_222054 [Morchella conica CCBAS932]|uniref:Transmembrane protein n=1 Tax=Morchella conica CCBAS932 TaxID=1392247 RepID=A0A3N4KPX3_9PEZI|nr:hypothetical protein P167DRAFT_222054 [Morchella conica CCBAS932]
MVFDGFFCCGSSVPFCKMMDGRPYIYKGGEEGRKEGRKEEKEKREKCKIFFPYNFFFCKYLEFLSLLCVFFWKGIIGLVSVINVFFIYVFYVAFPLFKK